MPFKCGLYHTDNHVLENELMKQEVFLSSKPAIRNRGTWIALAIYLYILSIVNRNNLTQIFNFLVHFKSFSSSISPFFITHFVDHT